jgi:hypothetical protein
MQVAKRGDRAVSRLRGAHGVEAVLLEREALNGGPPAGFWWAFWGRRKPLPRALLSGALSHRQRACPGQVVGVDMLAMNHQSSTPIAVFTAPEREFIRHELAQHFGSYPAVAEGLLLRTWRGGPQAGQPKLPPAVQTMLARDLVEIRIVQPPWPRAFFTAAGLAALRQLAANRRSLDPIRYAHVRRELGLQREEEEA